MKVLNVFMLTLCIVMSSVSFGIGVIGFIQANGWMFTVGLFFGWALALIVKHWDDVAQ